MVNHGLCCFNIVKLRQGSGKDRQGMVIKRPLKAPERPLNLNHCLELTLISII